MILEIYESFKKYNMINMKIWYDSIINFYKDSFWFYTKLIIRIYLYSTQKSRRYLVTNNNKV